MTDGSEGSPLLRGSGEGDESLAERAGEPYWDVGEDFGPPGEDCGGTAREDFFGGGLDRGVGGDARLFGVGGRRWCFMCEWLWWIVIGAHTHYKFPTTNTRARSLDTAETTHSP